MQRVGSSLEEVSRRTAQLSLPGRGCLSNAGHQIVLSMVLSTLQKCYWESEVSIY